MRLHWLADRGRGCLDALDRVEVDCSRGHYAVEDAYEPRRDIDGEHHGNTIEHEIWWCLLDTKGVADEEHHDRDLEESRHRYDQKRRQTQRNKPDNDAQSILRNFSHDQTA